MSEFPEWIEDRIGPNGNLTYEEAQQIHRSLEALEAMTPKVREILSRHVPPVGFWARVKWHLGIRA